MGRVERVYIRLYKRYAREEDALKCREGERLNGSHQRLLRCRFVPRSKHFSRRRDLNGAGLQQNLCHFARKKEDAEKYKKEPRARRAYSPFTPIRFSRVHTFPPNPTQLGLKFDNQRG